jgi:dipeptidyl aminopeptidase/acylaminoacyl peptidase
MKIMDAEKAYRIRLGGEIVTDGDKTFFTEKYIKSTKYSSNIYSIDSKNIMQVTNGGAEKMPFYKDGVLYYIKYSEETETLMKLKSLSEPEIICTFYKIKKYLISEHGIFVIALEKTDDSKPFATTRIKYRFNGRGLLRSKYSLYAVDKAPHKIYSGDFDVEDIQCNNSRFIIQTTEESDDDGMSNLYEINKDGNKIKKITKKPGVIHGYSISDKGRIAVSMHENLNPWEVNRIAYPEEGKYLLVGKDSNDSILTDLFFTPSYKMKYNGDVLYAIAQEGSSSNIYAIEGDKITKKTDVRGKLIDFDVAGISGKERISYVYSTPEHPSVIVNGDSYNINEDVAGIPPHVEKIDNGEYFFMLKDPAAPTLVFIHGGPQTAYGYLYYIEFQFFYQNGYNILYTNPPGSTGYGQAYEEECVGDWGNKDFEYIKKAMKSVMEKYKVVDNFAVTGGSYGGFMTNWIVTHSDIFKCGISERSISNMLSMVGTSDIGYWFNTLQLKITDPYSADGIKKLMEYSPISYIKNVKTPVMLITGEEDYRCPIEQAEQFYVALKLNNVDAELVRYPGDNHEHARSGVPENMKDRLTRKLAWFDKYLKN